MSEKNKEDSQKTSGLFGVEELKQKQKGRDLAHLPD